MNNSEHERRYDLMIQQPRDVPTLKATAYLRSLNPGDQTLHREYADWDGFKADFDGVPGVKDIEELKLAAQSASCAVEASYRKGPFISEAILRERHFQKR